MALYGVHPVGDSFPAFCKAFDRCEKEWGDNPAYRDYSFQIRQAIRGLALLEASPGQKAAHSALPPSSAGQEPTPVKEAPVARS